MKAAKSGAHAVREGAEQSFAGVLSALSKGVSVVSGVAAMLRGLDRDEALAWIGLARRHPFRSAAVFGAGIAVGAGLGVLFAPMAGADLRRLVIDRFATPKQAAPPSEEPVAVSPLRVEVSKPATAPMPS